MQGVNEQIATISSSSSPAREEFGLLFCNLNGQITIEWPKHHGTRCRQQQEANGSSELGRRKAICAAPTTPLNWRYTKSLVSDKDGFLSFRHPWLLNPTERNLRSSPCWSLNWADDEEVKRDFGVAAPWLRLATIHYLWHAKLSQLLNKRWRCLPRTGDEEEEVSEMVRR